jgi:hypothetical protein
MHARLLECIDDLFDQAIVLRTVKRDEFLTHSHQNVKRAAVHEMQHPFANIRNETDEDGFDPYA